jgi:xanthine dehydrogenase accessory factor
MNEESSGMGTDKGIFQSLAECERRGEPVALCTVIASDGSIPRHAGSKMLVYPDGRIEGTVGGGEMESRVISEARQALTDGKPRLVRYNFVDPQRGDPGVCGGTVQIYVDPVYKPKLVVIGGGHVGKAVCHLAKWLGFRVAICDDRPEFCTPEANPDADEFYPMAIADLPKHLTITPQTYLVLTTRGMPVDLPGLPALLDTPAAFIGLIGSKRRWLLTRKALAEAGVAEEKLARVHSPIGLELNAETPEEIAVSIMAEIIMIRNGGTGVSMKA